ncbi:MAG TPA: caspase family protein [Blastocatellia bacterium]|nr:caspase family protein [Blastocatellia bacterium]
MMSMIGTLLLAAGWWQAAHAQSTDSARPTPMTGKQLSGNIAAHDDAAYYYSFLGGPGKISLKVKLQKAQGFAYLKVEALDAGRRSLLTLEASSSSPEQGVLLLDRQQEIVLRLKSARSSESSPFVLNLDGPISFGSPPPAPGPALPPRPASSPRDNTPPRITITEPNMMRGQGVSGRSKIRVAGLATDESGVSEVTVRGQPASLDAGGRFSAEVFLKVGENRIPVAAVDIFGNPAEEVLTIQWNGTSAADGSAAQPEITGRYYALLIGVEKYQDRRIPQLDNPLNDVRRLAQVLTERYTFEAATVTQLANPTRYQMLKSFKELRDRLTVNDQLLIFYAGHGDWNADKDQGYWLPSDAEQDSTAQWFSNSDLRDEVKGIKAKHLLLISDACFSGGLFKTRGLTDEASIAIKEIFKLTSRKAITSGALKSVPDRSVFIDYLIKRLTDNRDPFLLANSLFVSMREAVINNSPNQQTPLYGTIQGANDEGGDFLFIRRP